MGKDLRRNYFIDRGFQSKFIIRFCLVLLVTSLLIGALFIFFTESSTTVAIENTKVVVKRTSDFIMPIMVQTLIIVTISSALSVIILTLFTSHKIAGPLYRVKKEIDRLKQGDLTSSCRIRKNDQLQNLANDISDLTEAWRDKHKLLRDKVLDIRTSLDSGIDVKDKVKELEDIQQFFKV